VKISPNTQAIIGAVVAVLSLIAQGGLKLPMGIPADWVPIIVSWDNFLIGIYLAAAPIMAGFSSSTPGILAPADPPAVVAAQKVADLPANASPALVAKTKAEAQTAIVDHQP
jgi:hypothetical protein